MSVDGSDDGEQPSMPERQPAARIPWCWPAWQKLTGVDTSPFSPEYNKDDSPWKSSEDNAAVWAFASNFWSLPENEQVEYMKRSNQDNDRVGRDLWLTWIEGVGADWGLNLAVDTALATSRVDPYSVMKRLKIAKVTHSLPFCFVLFFKLIIVALQMPEMASAQVSLCYPSLAEALFGSDAFTEDRVCLKEPVRSFVEALAATNWARLRKSVDRERTRLEPLRNQVSKSWNGMSCP